MHYIIVILMFAIVLTDTNIICYYNIYIKNYTNNSFFHGRETTATDTISVEPLPQMLSRSSMRKVRLKHSPVV